MMRPIYILCYVLIISIAAQLTIDLDLPNVSMASSAKAKCGQVLELVTNEGIQMYGGIGMTDDEEIGFFMKRARVAHQTFGDYNYHYNRYATLKGF